MRKNTRLRRQICVLLSLIMVISLLPTAVFAAENGETIKGDPVTIEVSNGAVVRQSSFNEGWKFYLGTSSTAQNPNFDDSGWKSVTLPHDFSISQSYTTSGEAESGFLPGGTGWYRKSFTLPESYAEKTLILNFDGVYSDAYVYVNGTFVGENHYGYTSFAFDITDDIICDGTTENVIAVKAVNNLPSSRWYSGSGIYRDVTLFAAAPVHVDLNGTYVTTPNISSGNGTVNVAVDIVNDGDSSASVTVTNTVVETGDSASTTVTVNASSTVTATASPVVSSPKLWSPDSPNLYTVRTELSVGNQVVDTYDTTFGFRWYSFDSTGFHLNEKNVKLNGVCLHHDQGALGSAANYDAMYRQLSIMKDMGANAIRTSHNPADEDFINICNELGLLVIEELFDGWIEAKNGNSNDFAKYFQTTVSNGPYGSNSSMTWAEFVTKSTVRRDRNDPSIILWSLGNEVQEGTNWTSVGSYASVAQNIIDWIKSEDTTRPTTSGDNNRGGDSRLVAVLNTILNNDGVVGFNYANSASSLYSLAQSYGGVIIASETSSATNSRGQYQNQNNNSNSDGNYHLTSYDTSAVGWGITAHDSIYNTYQYDCVAGEFVWTGFDYIGEPTPWNGTGSGDSGRGCIPNSSYFGIVETTGFEKDTYYLYRSQWNQDETTLHLVTAWDSDNMMTSSSKTPVVIYSNAPVVKLYRNGTLIGTATRTANTSSAGHTYYTYSTTSNNSSACTAVSASGSASLYATFNVTYASGTISAKAYNENGNEITLTGNSGKNSVSTPSSVSQLVVNKNKTEIAADGSSLVYISVEVTDANGVLDTTATNTINFSLSGNGEIVGVDNGDQATTAKYQQSSVLTSTTSANIAAYAGKALVIVRSTKDAGSFTVNASSYGLSGGSATVITTAVDSGTTTDGLSSYTMVRDYTVKVGTVPMFETTANSTMAESSTVTGTIIWDAIPEATYNKAGDYTISGVLTFANEEPISVTARLHVIDNVIALRNISTVTTPNTVPTLPTVVSGVLADGMLSGEFNATWDPVTADQFTSVGNIVTVNGSAVVFGKETLPVTCSIRVAEAVNTESTNVASSASSLTQDIASANQSDNLESIRNGITKPGDNTSERWTNWNNRYNSDTATLTFTWATAQLLSSVNLYYYIDNCSDVADSLEFEFSLNGTDFSEISFTDETIETYSLGESHTYTFDQVVNPVALRVTLTQKDGTTGNHCVGLTEVEIMTFAGSVEYNSSADLSGITVDGIAISDFAADTLSYEASGSDVAATTGVNAGITILPALDNVVRILTVSEDGSDVRTYAVTLGNTPVCAHANTEIRNVKDATCTEDGYTGDTYCADCGALVTSGETISASGHTTELRNAKAATCTEAGYTGDEVCTVCSETVKAGSTIAAKGHSWDSGVVTKEATETDEGIMTYTCTVCGETRTETIPVISPQKVAPSVTVSAARAASGTKITLTGTYVDYKNFSKYYDVTAHGLVYYSTSKLGTRTLTVNTPGRTNVKFSSYKTDGSFSYTMTPAYATTRYTVRAYLAYTAESGRTVYVYSDPIIVSYNSLTK